MTLDKSSDQNDLLKVSIMNYFLNESKQNSDMAPSQQANTCSKSAVSSFRTTLKSVVLMMLLLTLSRCLPAGITDFPQDFPYFFLIIRHKLLKIPVICFNLYQPSILANLFCESPLNIKSHAPQHFLAASHAQK